METQANPSGKRQPERLLRLPEVESRVSLRKSSIYALMAADPPAFPKAIKLSRRAVCWPESAIDAWVAERIKAAGQ